MRLRIQPDQEIVQRTRHRILAWPPVHAAWDTPDKNRAWPIVLFTLAMEWHIMQPSPACASGRCTICLIGVSINPAIEHGRIVASAAPFRRLGADRVLHVLDRLAIPLIVERRKMMRRTEPLVVDVLVAALAGIGFHEKLAGNFLLAVNLRGTGKERAFRPIALAVHIVGRHRGILNAGARLPTLAQVVRTVANGGDHGQADCGSERCGRGT